MELAGTRETLQVRPQQRRWRPASVARIGVNFTLIDAPKPLTTTRNLSTRTFSRVDVRLSYTNANWRGFNVFLGMIIYPDRRYEETAFTFGNAVGVSPKAPFTIQGGVFIPL